MRPCDSSYYCPLPFLLFPATLLLPQSILLVQLRHCALIFFVKINSIMLGKTWNPRDAAHHYKDYGWEGFAVVMTTNAYFLPFLGV